MLTKIATVIIIITWPLSLFVVNSPQNFLNYVYPALLILLSFVLFRKKYKYYFLPLFLIPFIQPKLAILPLLFLIINFNKRYLKFLILSFVILVFFFKPFFGQTIFVSDYEAKQKVLQEQKLYPSIFLARLFQNKARIPIDKLTNNFFALTDPNNYFFGFAPRQITIDNQNLKKFPFLSLPLFLVGAYYLAKEKNKKFILSILIASIINLTILTNFDRNDFILWVPISIIILNGLKLLKSRFKQKSKWYYFLLIIFAIPEILRIIIK